MLKLWQLSLGLLVVLVALSSNAWFVHSHRDRKQDVVQGGPCNDGPVDLERLQVSSEDVFLTSKKRASVSILRTSGDAAVAASAAASAAANDNTFHSLAEWMRDRNGFVHEHLQGAFRNHGGVSIRGVISTGRLAKDTVLISVPRNNWIWKGTPAFADLVSQGEIVQQKHSCRSLDPEDIGKMILAAGMAREKAKGNASSLYVALKAFPTYDDYHSFHLRFAGPEILRDFGSLDISEIAKALQDTDSTLQQCFIAWKSESQSIVGVEWRDVHESLEQIRTRSFVAQDVPGQPLIIVPLADLLNTAPASQLNTIWQFDNTIWQFDSTSFKMTAQGSEANGELYDGYCPFCDNRLMVLTWGVYLEDNAQRGLTCTKSQALNKLLHESTMAVLETHKEPSWTAPRCKAVVFKAPQGPMRCSLARLAWEACGSHWEYPASNASSFVSLNFPSHMETKRHKSKEWAVVQATLVHQSQRNQMHPMLLAGSSHV